MEKKLPVVVNIGGRRYVKNNINKSVAKDRMKLKDVVKAFGGRMQRIGLTQCIIEGENKSEIYGKTDAKVVFGRSNKLVGFLATGRYENPDMNRYKGVPDDLESIVEGINKVDI